MSIKGRPHAWFVASLKSGDLATALAEAHELPALGLADALALVLLMADRHHPAFRLAAARWSARLVLEHRLDLEQARFAIEALTALPHHPAQAKRRLADICAHHELRNVIGLPDPAPR